MRAVSLKMIGQIAGQFIQTCRLNGDFTPHIIERAITMPEKGLL
jgi:hypothetical protein